MSQVKDPLRVLRDKYIADRISILEEDLVEEDRKARRDLVNAEEVISMVGYGADVEKAQRRLDFASNRLKSFLEQKAKFELIRPEIQDILACLLS